MSEILNVDEQGALKKEKPTLSFRDELDDQGRIIRRVAIKNEGREDEKMIGSEDRYYDSKGNLVVVVTKDNSGNYNKLIRKIYEGERLITEWAYGTEPDDIRVTDYEYDKEDKQSATERDENLNK